MHRTVIDVSNKLLVFVELCQHVVGISMLVKLCSLHTCAAAAFILLLQPLAVWVAKTLDQAWQRSQLVQQELSGPERYTSTAATNGHAAASVAGVQHAAVAPIPLHRPLPHSALCAVLDPVTTCTEMAVKQYVHQVRCVVMQHFGTSVHCLFRVNATQQNTPM